MSVEFEEPPPARRTGRTSPFTEASQELRDNPGEWGVIARYEAKHSARAMVTAINAGRYSIWRPAGAFEAVSRLKDGAFCVYVRYLPDDEDDDE